MNDVPHLCIFDIPLMANIPNLVYLAPVSLAEYKAMLAWALNQTDHPVAIRVPVLPVSSEGRTIRTDYSQLNTAEVTHKGSEVALLGLGNFYGLAEQTAAELSKKGIHATVINPTYITGLDTDLLESLKKDHRLVVTMEDGVLDGGFGEKIARFYGSSDMKTYAFGLEKKFYDRYDYEKLAEEYNLRPELAAKKILDRMFPHEDEMELEYQFLAAKFAVAKTCEVEAEIQDDYLMNIAEDYIYTVFMAMEKESTYHYRELEKQIATFLKKISIRHDYMLVEWDDLHKDVQQQIQSSYAVCLTYSFHLEEKLGFVLTQDEIAWLALLIHQASMETGSEKQGIFVMATDPYSAKYEAMKIENEISNLEIIKIVHIHDFKPELTKGKLVISTVPLKEKRNNVIEITKHVTQLDINKIISQMDEYAQEMKNEQVIETVKKAFQKELIVIDALATTKKETIAQVSKLLLEQGCLSEDVTEKVFELEERRPTTIGSQIAMAHVYKDSVKKSGIAVMRMKYPVKWSRSSKVKLVFFLAINMEESNEILKLFKYLYALIDNKEDIQKILEANSSEEIYELLMEEFH